MSVFCGFLLTNNLRVAVFFLCLTSWTKTFFFSLSLSFFLFFWFCLFFLKIVYEYLRFSHVCASYSSLYLREILKIFSMIKIFVAKKVKTAQKVNNYGLKTHYGMLRVQRTIENLDDVIFNVVYDACSSVKFLLIARRMRQQRNLHHVRKMCFALHKIQSFLSCLAFLVFTQFSLIIFNRDSRKRGFSCKKLCKH